MNNPQIPKIIHYCWFGGKPLPPLAIKCINSWKKFFPGYEIKRWDESNFDVFAIPYTSQAYRAKKYAFVSDYARFKILYEEGGIYFDTDVEVIKSFEDILSKGAFLGCENPFNHNLAPECLHVNPGLGMGFEAGNPFLLSMLNHYKDCPFIQNSNGCPTETIVQYTTNKLVEKGLRQTSSVQQTAGINIYPIDYFCPMTPTLILNLTENSHSIHHYSASWGSKTERIRKKIKRVMGPKIVERVQPFILYCRKILHI